MIYTFQDKFNRKIIEPASEIIGDQRRLRQAYTSLLFAHMKYRSRQRAQPKIRHLATLDGCTCDF